MKGEGSAIMEETNRIKMMLIDAEEGILEQFQLHLQDHQEIQLVSTIRNGEEVIRKIQEEQPDVIVMDLLLPNGDGLSLLENIAQLHLHKEPFIIITSSITNSNVISQCFALGVDHYIMKPYAIDHVLRRTMSIMKDGNKIRKANESMNECTSSEHKLMQEVTSVLLELGMPTNVKGYQ